MISRSLAAVNPCSMCMPMGSILVFRGIEGCIPLFHGSQGCSTYMSHYLAHRFREPIDIATTALSERSAAYGGAENLKLGLRNIISDCHPKMIGIATTCLAETIGDDLSQIVREFKAESPSARDVTIITVSTPTYAASHEVGYRVALKSLVQSMARRSRPSGRINILVGSILSPADVRFLRRLLDDWDLGHILMPDISETLDAPIGQGHSAIPKGGTPIDDIRDCANSALSLTIGGFVQEPGGGDYLEKEFAVPHKALPLPISLEFTDLLMASLEEQSGVPIPERYERQREQLRDTMVDARELLADVKTAVYGDTEIVMGITRLMAELGMRPQIVATGAVNTAFAAKAAEIAPGCKVMIGADFIETAEEASSRDIELMVVPFTGRGFAKDVKVPLLQMGLPNHDRNGTSPQLLLGYEGSMYLLDSICNAILDGREPSRSETRQPEAAFSE